MHNKKNPIFSRTSQCTRTAEKNLLIFQFHEIYADYNDTLIAGAPLSTRYFSHFLQEQQENK